MNRSLKALEAERERAVVHYEMALELSDAPLKVALLCSRQTTLIERAIEARLETLRGQGDALMDEAGELLMAGAPSHEVVWCSSLGAAAFHLGACGSDMTTCNCLELAFDDGVDKPVSDAALSLAEEEARFILSGGCLNWKAVHPSGSEKKGYGNDFDHDDFHTFLAAHPDVYQSLTLAYALLEQYSDADLGSSEEARLSKLADKAHERYLRRLEAAGGL